MEFNLNSDKHIVKEVNKEIRNKGGGFCPYLINSFGKPYNCKTRPCDELINETITECPYKKYIKGE